MSILLDTCAAIWFSTAAGLRKAAVEALDAAVDRKEQIFVSPITAWEVGLLSAKGRLAWPISPKSWFNGLVGAEHMAVANLSPELLIESSFLPGSGLCDPADRIVVATAREFGWAVMTRDRVILDYAAAGHVRAIEC
jgi:PIN domain nuclease of toxin-antitoxin system